MARVMVVGSLAESLILFRGELLRDMVSMGHQVTACAPEPPSVIAERLAAIGVGYQSLPLRRTGKNPLHDLYSLLAFVYIFRKLRPDVVLNYTIKPSVYGSLGAAMASVRTISSMITGLGSSFSAETPLKRLFGSVISCLYRLGLRHNRVVFFQNPDNLQLFVDNGIVNEENRPTLINGSGVDLEYFGMQPLPSLPSFLLVARLLREKGICEYAAAARRLKSRYPQASFRLVGSPVEGSRGVPRSALRSWQDEGIIDYLGHLDDVRPAIADASIYVLPSFYGEGIPRSILEAMAMGRPVITTDAPGCRETVRPGINGFLVPQQDECALADAMEKLISDPVLRGSMGVASRALAEEKFDVRDVNRIILKELELWHEASV